MVQTPIAPKVSELLEAAEEALLAFYRFPAEHGSKLRCTNPLERVNLAYKGRKRTNEQQRQYRRLRRKLARVERTRLQPLS